MHCFILRKLWCGIPKTGFNLRLLKIIRSVTVFSTEIWSEFCDNCWIIIVISRLFSRRMRWVGHVARMGQGRGVYRDLVGKPEGKRPLGRPRRKNTKYVPICLQNYTPSARGSHSLILFLSRLDLIIGASNIINKSIPYEIPNYYKNVRLV